MVSNARLLSEVEKTNTPLKYLLIAITSCKKFFNKTICQYEQVWTKFNFSRITCEYSKTVCIHIMRSNTNNVEGLCINDHLYYVYFLTTVNKRLDKVN